MKSPKIKIWSKKHKAFIQEWSFGVVKNAELNLNMLDFVKTDLIPSDQITPQDFSTSNVGVVDSTCKIDRQGREIFEGDIILLYKNKFKTEKLSSNVYSLQSMDPLSIPDIIVGKGVVRYSLIDSALFIEAAVQQEGGGELNCLVNLADPRFLPEVIGNILENPELANETK